MTLLFDLDLNISPVPVSHFFYQEKLDQSATVRRNHLYEAGLLELKHGSIPYRKLRTVAVGCRSDTEFLAKLHILRLALDVSTDVDR